MKNLITAEDDQNITGKKTFTKEVAAPDVRATGINGLLPGRFVGEASGATPASGTYQIGDFVVDQATPNIYVYKSAATPTWVSAVPTTVGFIHTGAGSPEGIIIGAVGHIYLRTDGGAGTSLYVKESGSGSTGWVAK